MSLINGDDILYIDEILDIYMKMLVLIWNLVRAIARSSGPGLSPRKYCLQLVEQTSSLPQVKVKVEDADKSDKPVASRKVR